MTVQLDAESRPVAWGDNVRGEEIPDPPTDKPPVEYRWTGTEWRHNPRPPGQWYNRPGVVDPETRQLIKAKFETKGADALANLDSVEQNGNIPSEVAALFGNILALQYLGYVALTGERIQSVEDRFF